MKGPTEKMQSTRIRGCCKSCTATQHQSTPCTVAYLIRPRASFMPFRTKARTGVSCFEPRADMHAPCHFLRLTKLRALDNAERAFPCPKWTLKA